MGRSLRPGQLALLLLAAAGNAPAHAQSPTDAALRGRVIAPLGLSAAGETLTLRCDQREPQTIIAGAHGRFYVPHLPPADCTISTTAASITLHLVPGEVTEITLTSGPRIASVPLPSQELPALDDQQIAAQNAFVNEAAPAADASSEDEDQPAVAEAAVAPPAVLTESGMPGVQNDAVADGLSAQAFFSSGARTTAAQRDHAAFAQSAIASYRALPRTFSAQYSGSPGATIALVSRSAGDALHGDAFFVDRQSAWAAGNPFSIETHYRDGVVTSDAVKPHDARQQFGATISAPLRFAWLPTRWRNRIGVLGSVEEQLHEASIVSSPQLDTFYALTPTQTALLRNRGVGTAQMNAALDFLDSLSGTTQRTTANTLVFARVDLPATQRDQLTLAWNAQRFDSIAAAGGASNAVIARGLGSLGDARTSADVAAARWLHRFTPRFDDDLRVQLAHDSESSTPSQPLAQEPAIGPGGYAPEVSIQPNGFAFGATAWLGRAAYPDEHRVQLANTLTFVTARQVLQLGADWSRIDDRIASFANQEGTFLYDSGTTNGRAGGLVDFITDATFNVHAYPNGACPSINATVHLFCFRTFTQSFGPSQTEFVTHLLGGFFEDSFRLRDDLRLTAGLRYDYLLLPLPQTPNYTLDATFAPLGIHAATQTFPEDRNNLGPRLSVAWSPAIRRRRWFTAQLGYGAFYGRIAGQTLRAALADTALPATFTHVRITPSTVTQCPQLTTSQGFGYPCDYTTEPPAAVTQTSSATLFAANFRLPAVQRASLALEFPITPHLTLRTMYANSIATQLPATIDRNIAPSTTTTTFQISGGAGQRGITPGQLLTLPLYTQRLSTNYGAVTVLTSSANATYHAGAIEARVSTRSFTARASFTFSRAIDYSPLASAAPRLSSQFDPFRNGYDKGLSSLNVPERFTADAAWLTRLTVGPTPLRTTLSGFRLGLIALAASGAPYSYRVFGGTYLSGGETTMNGSGGATYLPTVGRNTLRLPARSRFDLRLARGFMLGPLHAEAFAQAFNVLNSVSLSRVETRGFEVQPALTAGGPQQLVFQDAAAIAAEGLNNPPFGTPLSSTTAFGREREIELGLRLSF